MLRILVGTTAASAGSLYALAKQTRAAPVEGCVEVVQIPSKAAAHAAGKNNCDPSFAAAKAAALAALERDGAVILRGARFDDQFAAAARLLRTPATPRQLSTTSSDPSSSSEPRSTLSAASSSFSSSPLPANTPAPSSEPPSAPSAQFPHPPPTRFVQSSHGRFHRSLMLPISPRSTNPSELVADATSTTQAPDLGTALQSEAPWLPIIVPTPNGADKELSMCQLLDSRPGSAAQMWHADNTRGGYTVIVAMCEVDRRNGPTAMQLGSHKLPLPSLPALATLVRTWTSVPSRLAYPHLEKHDILVYSSKLLHRGEANNSSSSRPVLVFRYDDPAAPAPGVGILGSQLVSLCGALLAPSKNKL